MCSNCHVYPCWLSVPIHQSFTVTNFCEKNLQVCIFFVPQLNVSLGLFYLFSFSSGYSCEQLVNIREQKPRASEVKGRITGRKRWRVKMCVYSGSGLSYNLMALRLQSLVFLLFVTLYLLNDNAMNFKSHCSKTIIYIYIYNITVSVVNKSFLKTRY